MATMTYSTSTDTAATAETARTVANEGWSVVGVLDTSLARRLLRAVDEVAARSPDAGSAGRLHQLSGLAQHPDLAAIVDWPPLLPLAVGLLSPNVYVNHSHLDVHPPHPPTGAHRCQLLGEQTVDPFYWASGELPLDPRSAGIHPWDP
jgi:ectoine hydroxylase